MNNYIIIFREPDGRKNPEHTNEEINRHRTNWANWWEKWSSSGNLTGGSSLMVEGCLITGDGSIISKQIHHVGTEIIGGFLLLKAETLDEATQIAASCPIFEFGGYAEVREYLKQ
jgi:hypothetical protein